MKKYVIIGSTGQLGTDLIQACRQAGNPVVGLTHGDIDICSVDSVDSALSGLDADVVVNTAACQGAGVYTAADQDVFFQVNAVGPWNLARSCRQKDRLLVHYSTDYVFGGDPARKSPYAEQDLPWPVNAYGASKLAGEHLVRAFCPRHYVVRVASLYGLAGCRAKGNSNFVKMVMGKAERNEPIEVVNDQFMSPTWTHLVAGETLELVGSDAEFGLYHMAGGGSCSWYEFATRIVELLGARLQVTPIQTPQEDPDAIFLRPRYTALDNAALRRAGLADLANWQEALEQYIRKEQGE